jgi:hypothetical protein
MKQNQKRKQTGGGMHSEYCPLCLLSYEPLPEIEEEEEYDDDDEEEEKEENHLKKLSNVDLSWLQNGLAFDRDTNEILPVEGDDMYGRFPIKGRESNDLFTSEITIGNDGDSGWGPVYHEDCIKYVSAQLNRPITYEDGIEILKLVEYRRGPFQGQHFEWEEAAEEEGPAYFYSPMDPKGQDARDRINQPIAAWISRQKRVASPTGKRQLDREDATKELARIQAELQKALARVDELRREVAARKKALASLASPKKTQKRASKPQSQRPVSPPQPQSPQPQSPQPQSPQSHQQANCSSHKTQEQCPPAHCVWGKTNRCSKKRNMKK